MLFGISNRNTISPNSPATLSTSLVPRMWWQMPCPTLSARFLPLPPPFRFSLPFPLTSPPPILISQLSLPFKLTARQCRPCYPILPSPWSPFPSRAPRCSVMCPPASRGLWFLNLSAVSYSLHFTSSLILVFVLPGDCCPRNLCAWPLKRCRPLGQRLSPLSAEQDPVSREVSCPEHRRPWKTFCSRASGSGGAPSFKPGV